MGNALRRACMLSKEHALAGPACCHRFVSTDHRRSAELPVTSTMQVPGNALVLLLCVLGGS